MNSYLEAIDKENLLVDFIRHYWSTQEGLTRHRELFSKIKIRFQTALKQFNFLKILFLHHITIQLY